MLFSLLLLLLQFVHQFPLGSNTFRHLVVLHHGQHPLQEAISGLTKVSCWSVGSVKVAQIFQDLPSEAQHLGHWLHLFSFKPWRIQMERQRGHAFSRQKSEIRMIRKGMVHWKFQFNAWSIILAATSDPGPNKSGSRLTLPWLRRVKHEEKRNWQDEERRAN